MLYMFMYDRFDHAPTINYYSWYSKNDFLVLLCNWIKISNYSHVHVIWFRIHAFMQTLLASQQYVICVIEELYLTLHYNLICCVITFKNTGDGKYFKIKQRFFFKRHFQYKFKLMNFHLSKPVLQGTWSIYRGDILIYVLSKQEFQTYTFTYQPGA